MADIFLKSFGEVASLLKIDFSLDETTIAPEQLRDVTNNITNHISDLMDKQKTLLTFQTKIQSFEPFVICENEPTLNSAEILARLPQKLEYGEAFLTSQRDEAVHQFELAKVDPTIEMSANDKAIRSRIAHSHDLAFIKEQLTLYKEIADGRFGPLRSAESAPIEKEPKTQPAPTYNQDREDAEAMFKKGGKR